MSAAAQAIAASGLLRVVCAVASGALLALSFPRPQIPFAGFVALIPIILASAFAPTARQAFFLGTVFYSVTWLINVPWVIVVMSQYGGLPRLTGILLYVAMSIYLSLYGSLFTLGVRLLRPGRPILPWLVVPLLWTLSEYVRSHLLSGFPWNLLAVSIIDHPALVQVAAIAGPYAVGALMVAVSAVMACLVSFRHTTRATAGALFMLGLFLVAWFAAGSLLLRRQHERMRSETKLRAALIQPNITQEMRWSSEQLLAIFERMRSLTARALIHQPVVVVWPESTVPLSYFSTPFYREFVEQISLSSSVDLILGSVAEDSSDPTKIWNAAYLISRGRTTGRYDKMHLVPFGEYVPLRKFLFFAEKLVKEVGEFQFGTNERPLVGRQRYGPAICYEIVFPQLAARQVANGAEVLVTITNDGWFGTTAAPYQHLDAARLRAVETDRYVLRAATTGVSAVIVPTGELSSSLPFGREGIVSDLFAARQSRTPYVRFGDWFAVAAVLVSVISIIIRRRAAAQ